MNAHVCEKDVVKVLQDSLRDRSDDGHRGMEAVTEHDRMESKHFGKLQFKAADRSTLNVWEGDYWKVCVCISAREEYGHGNGF